MGTPKLKCFGIELQATDHQVLINHWTFNIWVWLSSFLYLMLTFFLIFQCRKTVTSLNASRFLAYNKHIKQQDMNSVCTSANTYSNHGSYCDGKNLREFLDAIQILTFNTFFRYMIKLSCLNEREESAVNQHNLFRKMLYSNNETTCFGL